MYDSLVFAGGGNRCFWQAGFWEEFTRNVEVKPASIASVSAGSAISCAIFANRIKETLEATMEVQSTNLKNRYWSRALQGKNVHPHSDLYRQIIHKALDEQSLQTLKEGPANRILLAEIPSWLGARSAVLVGMLAYQLEKKLRHPVHPSWGRKIGFRSRFVTANSCNTVDELADLILSSSCTPPFTPIMRHQGDVVLDGGMVDNVPIHGVDTSNSKTLVMLSRPYASLPKTPNVHYVAPSKKPPIESWDYTSPDRVLETYQQGKSDAKLHLRAMAL